MDHEEESLRKSESIAFGEILKLVDVSDEYKDDIRLIAATVISNPYLDMKFYLLGQLSELGTGFDSSFENGGTQSDIREDVLMNFISQYCGSSLDLRVRGKDVTLRPRYSQFKEPSQTFQLRGDRAQKIHVINLTVAHWWNYG